MPSTSDPTQIALESLLSGDTVRLQSLFNTDPTIDDPLGGHVDSAAAFCPYFEARHAWLVERQARLEPIRLTQAGIRSVFECLLYLQQGGKEIELPLAAVGDHVSATQLSALRIYHSLWPLFEAHRVRPPLLSLDPSIHLSDVIAEYQHALKVGDIPGIVGTFEPDGYFREPAGGEWFYQGRTRLNEIMTLMLTSGGIHLEHCSATDDGVACAIEFNAVQFGKQRLQPQAGVAVYQRGPSGRLHAARVYDDVNVEALAAQQ